MWLKAYASNLILENLIYNFIYSVNGTLFLRSDDRSAVECVWNGNIEVSEINN